MQMKSTGACSLCKKEFSRQGMSRHLSSCIKKRGREGEGDSFHLFVTDKYCSWYWLHLLVYKEGTLFTLDRFLRDIWLECCNHLSAFTIDGKSYSAQEDLYMDSSSYHFHVSLEEVLSLGMKFEYEYDFGSTTQLSLKVLGESPRLDKKEILVLSRNYPPGIPCFHCDNLAAEICSQCIYEGEGYLCEDCASNHPCGEEMLLPLVNSPRAGVCGYCG